MNKPSVFQQLLYLGQLKTAPEGYRGWVQHIIEMPDERKRGVLLATPNAVIVAIAGLGTIVLTGSASGLIFLAAAPIVLVAGATIPAISTRRLKSFASKHRAATSFPS